MDEERCRIGPRDIWREFEELQRQLGRILDRFFAEELGEGTFAPAADLYDLGELVLARFALPAVIEEDVDIFVAGDELVVRGEAEAPPSVMGKEAVVREIRVGSFERKVSLPPGLDPDAMEVRSEDGVLEVRIPRSGG